MRLPALLPLCFLVACSSGEANHLGNPLLWPIGIVSNGLDNASYNAKRRKVEAHVAAHYPALMAQIKAGGGAQLSRGMDLAGVPDATRPTLRDRLRADIALFQNDPEALVVALMVHGA